MVEVGQLLMRKQARVSEGSEFRLVTMHAGIADVWRNGNFWRAHCN